MNSIHRIILIAALATPFAATNALAGDFQQETLFNPGKFQLQAEDNGRVMIYDRMDNETVELAMTEQFDRIENMMFIRTQYALEDGGFEETDDCD